MQLNKDLMTYGTCTAIGTPNEVCNTRIIFCSPDHWNSSSNEIPSLDDFKTWTPIQERKSFSNARISIINVMFMSQLTNTNYRARLDQILLEESSHKRIVGISKL